MNASGPMVFNYIAGSTDYTCGPWTFSPQAHCPDLLRYEQIGPADNFRGRVVRAFFWLMRAWPVKR